MGPTVVIEAFVGTASTTRYFTASLVAGSGVPILFGIYGT